MAARRSVKEKPSSRPASAVFPACLPDGYVLFDRDGRAESINDEATRLFSTGRGQASPPTVVRRIAKVLADYAEIGESGSGRESAPAIRFPHPIGIEIRINRRTIAEFRVCPLEDGRNLLVIRDITVRHQADQERIAQLRDHMRAETLSQCGFWHSNVRTGETRLSPSLYQMLGLTLGEEITMVMLMERCHASDLPEMRSSMQKAIDEKSDFACDVRMICPDGYSRMLRLKGVVEDDLTNGQTWMFGVATDISSQKMLESELRLQASTDALTGLVNRRAVNSVARTEILRARRHGTSLGLIMIDIDHFKKVNDTYGHVFGDLVLKKVATVSKDTLRTIDTMGRLGGEEFCAILPETPLEGTIMVAQRIRESIEALRFEWKEHKSICLTVSCGVTFLGPNQEFVDMYDIADKGLYMAKQEGRNRVVALDPNQERVEIPAELAHPDTAPAAG